MHSSLLGVYKKAQLTCCFLFYFFIFAYNCEERAEKGEIAKLCFLILTQEEFNLCGLQCVKRGLL